MDYKERDKLVKKQLELLRNNTSDENLEKVFKEITAINRQYNETQFLVSQALHTFRAISQLTASSAALCAELHGNGIH